jgi:DNA-binding response OmpR family regulator
MRTLIVSRDPEILNLGESTRRISKEQLMIYKGDDDPLDVMSTVCELNPSLLIIDDDFLQPETVHVLKSIRKVNKSIKVIFITSNTHISLGKEVSPMGIWYYAIKPLDTDELIESFQAVIREQKRQSLNV